MNKFECLQIAPSRQGHIRDLSLVRWLMSRIFLKHAHFRCPFRRPSTVVSLTGQRVGVQGRRALVWGFGGATMLLAKQIPLTQWVSSNCLTGSLRKSNRHFSKFWWVSKADDRKIHRVYRDKLCMQKGVGSLGFRDLEAFNVAFLSKQIVKPSPWPKLPSGTPSKSQVLR